MVQHDGSPAPLVVLAILERSPLTIAEIARRIDALGAHPPAVGVDPDAVAGACSRLLADGLVTTDSAPADGPSSRPYRISERGRETVRSETRRLLAERPYDVSSLGAAFCALLLMPSRDAVGILTERRDAVRAELDRLVAAMDAPGRRLGPVPALELGYAQAVASAERDWLTAAIRDLTADRAPWNAVVREPDGGVVGT